MSFAPNAEGQPTAEQLQCLDRLCYQLTNVMFQPIHIVRLDERTLNIFVLAGKNEEIEMVILLNSRIEP
ncbi:DUF6888 family protein [Nostoc sp. MS1]|uniref:DUF6888 family protein n=1 Tax=Nostoc sp. MS1 TaxID=2764711 RepID=UPI001CC69ECD|nr:hypothetical protein [Nostoc sp. MS1]BCL36927.1 hypothetical protein NSMS1_33740 [Nostoc sp. MS1]